MRFEISEDFICSSGFYNFDDTCYMLSQGDYECKYYDCSAYHRKHPTLEQYKEEYGKEVSENMPVWYRLKIKNVWNGWVLDMYEGTNLKMFREKMSEGDIKIVIACTSFGKPSDDWRPE